MGIVEVCREPKQFILGEHRNLTVDETEEEKKREYICQADSQIPASGDLKLKMEKQGSFSTSWEICLFFSLFIYELHGSMDSVLRAARGPGDPEK